MDQSIFFVKFLFRENWAPLEEVLGQVKGDYGPLHEVSGEGELTGLLAEGVPCMVIASIRNKEDLAVVLGYLKANRKFLKDAAIKFAAVNFLNNRQVEAALMKIGCQEVLDPNLKGKPLKFKLDFWKKALKGAQAKANAGNTTVKEKEASKAAAAQEAKNDAPVWDAPLEVEDDMWLAKPGEAKRVLGKWLIKFMGPSPFVAQWADVPGQKGLWKFVFKEGLRGEFHTGGGDWYYQGEQRPEFVWKENLWMVSGRQFQLYHREGAGETQPRFRAGADGLHIARNSVYAQTREPQICETFDQEVMVKKGLTAPGEAHKVENDQDQGGHLSGQTEGEAALGGPLKGKSSTDQLNGGPLKGKTEGTDRVADGSLEGKYATAKPADGTLAGEYAAEKPASGAMEGKYAAEKPADGTLAGNLGTDALENESGEAGSENVGPTKYKGKLKYSNETRETHYGGKSETDDLGPGHYGEEANAKRATDDLGPGHYGGKDKPGAGAKGAHDAPAADRPPEGKMDGDIATDDLGPGHYGGKDKPGAGAKGAHDAPAADRPPEGKMEGVIATDDLGPGHMGGKPKGVLRFPDKLGQGAAPKADAPKGATPILREAPEIPAAKAGAHHVDEALANLNDAPDDVVAESAQLTALLRRWGEQGSGEVVKVDDYFDGQLILRSAAAYAPGEQVEVFMSFEYMKRAKKTTLRATCLESVSDGEGSTYLTLELGESQGKIFEGYMQLFRLRQQHITDFIKKARGI